MQGLQAQNWSAHLLEIVIVENASGDDSLENLHSIPGTVTIVVSSKILGLTVGCNLGVEKASGEYVAFLNNDARPHAD